MRVRSRDALPRMVAVRGQLGLAPARVTGEIADSRSICDVLELRPVIPKLKAIPTGSVRSRYRLALATQTATPLGRWTDSTYEPID